MENIRKMHYRYQNIQLSYHPVLTTCKCFFMQDKWIFSYSGSINALWVKQDARMINTEMSVLVINTILKF